jgi:hypothetical protein
MKLKLTDAGVRQLPGPKPGPGKKTRCRVFYDQEVSGFGVQINASGGRSFILNYSFHGRERRKTIGIAKDWRTASARTEAKRLRRLIDLGTDPMAEIDAARGTDRPRFVRSLCRGALAQEATQCRVRRQEHD